MLLIRGVEDRQAGDYLKFLKPSILSCDFENAKRVWSLMRL